MTKLDIEKTYSFGLNALAAAREAGLEIYSPDEEGQRNAVRRPYIAVSLRPPTTVYILVYESLDESGLFDRMVWRWQPMHYVE